MKNGVTQQENLPLKHVSKEGNLLQSSLLAILVGFTLSLILVFLHIFWRSKGKVIDEVKKVISGETELPWRTAYATLTVLVMVFTWLYMLSYSYHVLGTDKVGGDVLYHSLKSIRTGVLIGISDYTHHVAGRSYSWCQCRAFWWLGR